MISANDEGVSKVAFTNDKGKKTEYYITVHNGDILLNEIE